MDSLFDGKHKPNQCKYGLISSKRSGQFRQIRDRESDTEEVGLHDYCFWETPVSLSVSLQLPSWFRWWPFRSSPQVNSECSENGAWARQGPARPQITSLGAHHFYTWYLNAQVHCEMLHSNSRPWFNRINNPSPHRPPDRPKIHLTTSDFSEHTSCPTATNQRKVTNPVDQSEICNCLIICYSP